MEDGQVLMTLGVFLEIIGFILLILAGVGVYEERINLIAFFGAGFLICLWGGFFFFLASDIKFEGKRKKQWD